MFGMCTTYAQHCDHVEKLSVGRTCVESVFWSENFLPLLNFLPTTSWDPGKNEAVNFAFNPLQLPLYPAPQNARQTNIEPISMSLCPRVE